ncbi:FemAB family PEP-CTERM system-associated protein [Alphaproteobacteria bacterium LMG 31809]|uniref:FemAB family PEP-CTERM system-associated protein n=1 Tax=Govanella unica TaxID=2975056 RepID=A0A9X3Z6W1_9PROT|nr:FemAB family PEP-CTERM system-associated protein [Govania unica]
MKRLSLNQKSAWDAFVLAHPDGTFFHRAGWSDVISESFGHRTHYLMAMSGGEIRGILPLTEIRSRLFGRSLISNAFCVYGGPLSLDEEADAALDAAAWKIAEESGIPVLEYRSRRRTRLDWPAKDNLYVTFRKELSGSHDDNLKAIPRKQRAMVRKAIDRGLIGVVDPTPDRFFAMYSASVRNLGTPVFSRRYFERLMQEFGSEDCDVVTIEHDGQAVSSVLNFYFRDEVLPYYGGGTAAARGLAANDFMYWEVMRRSTEYRGCNLFDFGRSKIGTGAFSFKKNWGFEPEPLVYEYRLAPGAEVPDINPLNPKYRLMVETWKRLPLWLANSIGPFISRDLG